MNNEEISRYIHVEIMGKCWHEREVDDKGTGGFKVKMRCVICGGSRYRSHCGGDNPNYCSDDSPRRLLNEVVAKVLKAKHWTILDTAIGRFVKGNPPGIQLVILELTAEQIATACVEAHKLTAKPAA